MPSQVLEEVQPGWRVYVGPDEVGKVSEARDHEIDVTHGMVVKHTYRVPEALISDATDGVVDLTVDRDAFEDLEVR